MNLSRVQVAGRLTHDPELRSTASGLSIAKFSVAVNQRDVAHYFKCVAFGKTAEFIVKYFEKGKAIFIEGRLSYSEWEGSDGGKRSGVEIIAEQVQFVGTKNDQANTL